MRFYKLFIILFFSFNSFCQKTISDQNSLSEKQNVILDYSKLSADSLNNLLDRFMKEAYFTCQNYIPEYVNLSKDLIQRSIILNFREKDLTGIKNISEVAIKNKCNSNLSHSNQFNLNTFNPIIYRLNFLSNQDQLFRLYNSNYVLYIKGK
jgi:hypothetical protein